jgi:hypothetical protein
MWLPWNMFCEVHHMGLCQMDKNVCFPRGFASFSPRLAMASNCLQSNPLTRTQITANLDANHRFACATSQTQLRPGEIIFR